MLYPEGGSAEAEKPEHRPIEERYRLLNALLRGIMRPNTERYLPKPEYLKGRDMMPVPDSS